MDSMLDRFSGDEGRGRLTDQLVKQLIVAGNAKLAATISDVGEVIEATEGQAIIRQDAADNDLFLIVSGSLRIIVNGRDVALRRAGEHVGEMAIVDPSTARTAAVVAAEKSILVKLAEPDFIRIANEYSDVWRAVAVQLSRRLHERRRFHSEPNILPVVFIGSSSERLTLAEALKESLPSNIARCVLWSHDVFQPSHFTIDDLDAQLRPADFAVLIIGADDKVTSRGVESDAPRDNVIFELGLFMGALTRYRTFLFVPQGMPVKIPSDLLGITTIRYDGAATDPRGAIKPALKQLLKIIEKNGPK